MTGTYRLTLRYEYDGGYSSGANARKSIAKNKSIDRRIKRREHHNIIAEALREYESEASFDLLDTIDEYDDEASMYDLAAEYDYETDDPSDYDDYGWYYDPYDYYQDDCYDYSAGSLSHQGITSMDLNARIIKHEDCGKSLGEILEEVARRRNDASW